jgi:hypothetical protein
MNSAVITMVSPFQVGDCVKPIGQTVVARIGQVKKVIFEGGRFRVQLHNLGSVWVDCDKLAPLFTRKAN